MTPGDLARALGVDPTAVVPVRGGLLHRTFRCQQWVLQELNLAIFDHPDALRPNLDRMTATLRDRGVPTLDFTWFDDDRWRVCRWVEDTADHSPAHAFGRFAAALADLGPSDLIPVIDGFADLNRWIAAFRRATGERSDPDVTRARSLVDRLTSDPRWASWGELPARVAHHDAKVSNVVADTVIDLDTTMVGTVLSDIGNLVRSLVSEDRPEPPISAAEVSRVETEWFSGWGQRLDEVEIELLPLAGPVVTIENALRFLTDHASGNVYFRVDDDEHNLRRFRAQSAHAERLLDLGGPGH